MEEDNTKPKAKRKHVFEIQIYDEEWEKADKNNGKPVLRPVMIDPQLGGNGRPPVIEFADKEELQAIVAQYKMCGQQIKLLREIDPFDDPPLEKETPKVPSIPTNNQAIPVNAAPSNIEQSSVSSIPVTQPNVVSIAKPKPKIVTIGDIEVKYDGDKVYQKQWMKLTPAEASNFRIVNDANNKIVSLNGKHIEAKRWTLVEDSDANQDDSVENLIEG